MNKSLLFFFGIQFFIYSVILFFKDAQAGSIFIFLFVFFLFFIFKALSIKNNLLTAILILSGIAHVIGAPLFILNKQDYSFSGWNAVRDFDFSTFFFMKVYAYSLFSLFLLLFFISILSRHLKFKAPLIQNLNSKINKNVSQIWTVTFFLLLAFSIFIAIFMYVNNIAILGIESDRLPFKLVGILFYFRGYFLPFLLFFVFWKTSRSFIVSFFFIIASLVVGALSASRGVTFIYMFPVLLSILNRKIAIREISLILFLIFLGYFTTSLTRDAMYSSNGLSILELSSLIFNTTSSFKSEEGMLSSILSIISTMSNRLYGAQDSVLAYQYELINPWVAFFNFIYSGTLVDNLAEELYGLVFLPGAGYGVGLGLVALLVMIGRSSILLMVIAILYFSFLIFYLNRLLKRAFFDFNLGKYPQIYYLFLFIISFNFVQATMSFIYLSFLLCYIIIFIKFFLKKLSLNKS
jgi:hypothetical protein